MTSNDFRWMTVHRVTFVQEFSALETSFAGPDQANKWLFGPDSAPDPRTGMRSMVSRHWGGAAFYRTREDADATLASAEASLPFLSEAAEHWIGLGFPYAHRGKVNWFGTPGAENGLATAQDDPGGPIAVMTSAGYNPSSYAERSRLLDFRENVDRIVNWFGGLDANIVRGVYSFMPGYIDGMTFSVWQSESAMIESAYNAGVHRTQVDRYKKEHTADRTSFTRLRILGSAGTWEGRDPCAELLG